MPMFPEVKPIHNFPSHYTWIGRFYANLLTWLGHITIRPGNNLLNKEDLRKCKHHLKVGDVVLAGALKYMSSQFITGPVTHAMLYIGKNQFIHSIAGGVEVYYVSECFKFYDTLAILRYKGEKSSKKSRKEKMSELITFARTQIGTPYNFTFEPNESTYSCAELVKSCFDSVEWDSKLPKPKKHLGYEAIHPTDFLKGDFRLVFCSHNLDHEGNKLSLNDEATSKLQAYLEYISRRMGQQKLS